MESITQEIQNAELVQLDICSLNSEGQGVARLDGLTVFVSGAITGDQVEAVIEQRKSNYAIARLHRLLKPSADRIEPFCAVACRCGGCMLQPMRYAAQLLVKQEQVVSALTRIGGFTQAAHLIRPIIGMKDPYHYRAKVQFPVSGSAKQTEIGFFAARSHEVVDGTECGIQHPVADAVRAIVRSHCSTYSLASYNKSAHEGLLRHIVVRIGFATGQVMVILVINGDEWPCMNRLVANLQEAIQLFHTEEGNSFSLYSLYLNHHRQRTNLVLGDKMTLAFGQPKIEERLLGLQYAISPMAFFQVNPVQTAVLYQTVLDFAALTGTETVLDLYCGTGSISLLLAHAARLVIGIEVVPQAVEDARYNAQINGLAERVRFQTGKAETILPIMAQSGIHADLVVVDPPRKGCDARLLDAIIVIHPPRLVYVSCNPATLARDLAYLSQNGQYQIEAVQPLDLFPWTTHVECVVLMSRVTS